MNKNHAGIRRRRRRDQTRMRHARTSTCLESVFLRTFGMKPANRRRPGGCTVEDSLFRSERESDCAIRQREVPFVVGNASDWDSFDDETVPEKHGIVSSGFIKIWYRIIFASLHVRKLSILNSQLRTASCYVYLNFQLSTANSQLSNLNWRFK